MATSVLRPFVVAALAMRTKTFGRSGPATSAKPEDFKNVLRFMASPGCATPNSQLLLLKLRTAQLQRQLVRVRGLHDHARQFVRGQIDGEIHAIHFRAAVDPRLGLVAV